MEDQSSFSESENMALPRFVVFQSRSDDNDKYLSYMNEDHEEMHGYMKFSGVKIVSPFSKFEVVKSKRKKGFVHIKCCYNNKYWVGNSGDQVHGIVAGADKQDEDQSQISGCTLFEPVYLADGTMRVRFRYGQLGNYICLRKQPDDDDPYASILASGTSNTPAKESLDIFKAIDWETLLVLPKHVAFKGDNKAFLNAVWAGGHTYLQYALHDVAIPTVENEIFTHFDGSIRIKNKQFGKFWKRGINNWIWAETDELLSYEPDSRFWPVKVDENVIALCNLGNNFFCERLTRDGAIDSLNAGIPTITKETHIEVVEPVISRSVYDVNFHLMDGSVYDETIVTMATGDAINRTKETNYMDVKLTYTENSSWNWDTSLSLKLGIKMSFRAGIPIIADGKIKISADFTGKYEWGKDQSSEEKMEVVHKTVVPPNSRVKVSLVVTKGSYDVPFSYSQRDILTNGKHITYDMDDGICTGINCYYNFKYETTQEHL